MSSTDSPIYTTADSVATAEVGGETVLLHLDQGIYYGLNEVGTRVWKMLDTPTALADLHRALLDEYEVAPERCRTDLEQLLADLRQHELVRRMERAETG